MPLTSTAKIYAPDQTGGVNSEVIIIQNETTGSTIGTLSEIVFTITSVQSDSGGNYLDCSKL